GGSRKSKGPQRNDLVRRRRGRFCKRLIRQPADITVACELPPGPAFAVAVVDRDALAFQRLRLQRSIRRRRLTQRRKRIDNLEHLAINKALRLNLAFEKFGGQVRPGRGQARIIHSGRSTAGRWPGPPGTRPPRGAPVLPTASSRRCPHAASSTPPRRSA